MKKTIYGRNGSIFYLVLNSHIPLTLNSPMRRKGVKRTYMKNTATRTVLRKITDAERSQVKKKSEVDGDEFVEFQVIS